MASAVIFHLIAVLHFYFGFWYDRTYITKPDTEWRGYKFGGRLGEIFGIENYSEKLIKLFFF